MNSTEDTTVKIVFKAFLLFGSRFFFFLMLCGIFFENVEFEIEEDSWSLVDAFDLESASEHVSASDLGLSESELISPQHDPIFVALQERIKFLEEELTKVDLIFVLFLSWRTRS
jgi:hypothetical protein